MEYVAIITASVLALGSVIALVVFQHLERQEFKKERQSWKEERAELLDRIQAGDLSEFKAFQQPTPRRPEPTEPELDFVEV